MSEKNQMPDKQPSAEQIAPREPVKLFDDYYFIGNRMVGFHVLKTDEGLVLFDAMDLSDADETFLLPGLKKLGLEKEKIRMIFLTHGHFDHYLGAEKVRLRTDCGVAMSEEDSAYMMYCHENRDKEPIFPHITHVIRAGDEFVFGSHVVTVVEGRGHTPGCLNFSFEVHEGAETHRVIMMGGYGVFGPGRYPDPPYPYSLEHAVDAALQFAGSCVSTWEFCKEKGVDVYINPHPHLCELFEKAEENQRRRTGEPNAHVIGCEGVRRWIAERYDVAMSSVEAFTDIRRSLG